VKRVVAAFAACTVAAALLASPRAGFAQSSDTRSIARDGYVYGYPLVLMEVTKHIATAASSTGQFVHMLSGPTPIFRVVVAPNGDTRYSSAWVDLSSGPQILHVPDAGGRYFVAQVMDAWTDVIADPTPRIADSSPANYVLVGPGWKGAAGPGQRLVRSSTNDVWVLARTRALPDDAPELITAIQQQYTVMPLSRFGDPAYARVDAPATREEKAALGRLTAEQVTADELAGEPGTTFDAAHLDAARRAQLDDGVRDARALLDRYDPPVPRVNGWRWTKNTGRFGIDYLYRAFIAQTLLAANLPEDAVYAEAIVDANGAPLTGTRDYALHFGAAQLPPARAFWSLTLYSPDHYLVPNAFDRYTLRDANLRRNADGSIDVTIQHDAPRGDRTNWLPAPAGPFVVMLRMYWPLPAGLDGTYHIPALQPR